MFSVFSLVLSLLSTVLGENAAPLKRAMLDQKTRFVGGVKEGSGLRGKSVPRLRTPSFTNDRRGMIFYPTEVPKHSFEGFQDYSRVHPFKPVIEENHNQSLLNRVKGEASPFAEKVAGGLSDFGPSRFSIPKYLKQPSPKSSQEAYSTGVLEETAPDVEAELLNNQEPKPILSPAVSPTRPFVNAGRGRPLSPLPPLPANLAAGAPLPPPLFAAPAASFTRRSANVGRPLPAIPRASVIPANLTAGAPLPPPLFAAPAPQSAQNTRDLDQERAENEGMGDVPPPPPLPQSKTAPVAQIQVPPSIGTHADLFAEIRSRKQTPEASVNQEVLVSRSPSPDLRKSSDAIPKEVSALNNPPAPPPPPSVRISPPSGLLEEIQQGRKLKTADEQEALALPQLAEKAPRENLLEAIQKGTQLKSAAEQNPLNPPMLAPKTEAQEAKAILDQGITGRRRALSDSTLESSGLWNSGVFPADDQEVEGKAAKERKEKADEAERLKRVKKIDEQIAREKAAEEVLRAESRKRQAEERKKLSAQLKKEKEEEKRASGQSSSSSSSSSQEEKLPGIFNPTFLKKHEEKEDEEENLRKSSGSHSSSDDDDWLA